MISSPLCYDGRTLIAVGHRVVHGERDFDRPVVIDDSVLAAIERLTPLAPLHQPRSIEPIRAVAALRPDLAQVACFDTMFHVGLEPPVSRYAIPRHYEAEGIRKYGFHGLSYEFIARRLEEISPEMAAEKVIVAHLGNGASLCAMRDGRSVDTTMGFSALDGLMMGTRCGTIDPGILLYLQKVHGLGAEQMEELLYRQSGLLGVSGKSGDMRSILASNDPHSREAFELFVLRAAQETAAMGATLGGLDTLVFTGGIGENSFEVRAAICGHLSWLGVQVDPERNRGGAERISSDGSRVNVLTIPTNEELVIARHSIETIGRHGADDLDATPPMRPFWRRRS